MTDRSDQVADEQQTAEQVDVDKVDVADFPPERPLGVEDWGTTPLEEEAGESVRQRSAREDHRVDLREPADPAAALLEPDEEDGLDVTGESVATLGDDPDLLTAEEAAVHVIGPADEREVLGIDAQAIDDQT